MKTRPEKLLAPEQLRDYEEQGYCIVEDLLAAAEVAALLARIDDYSRGARALPEGMRMQIEPRVARGELTVANRAQAVRKLEELIPRDDLFTALALNPQLVSVMEALLGPDLKLYRSQALLKPPGAGSAKGVHQDSPYWPIEPMALASCWIALDRATTENGCMLVIPGSHRRGPLPHVATTDDYVIPEGHYGAGELKPVEMPPGAGLVFHSLLIHGTAHNTSPHPRRAVVLTYMPAASRYTYRNKITPEPKPEYFRISGEDVAGGV